MKTTTTAAHALAFGALLLVLPARAAAQEPAGEPAEDAEGGRELALPEVAAVGFPIAYVDRPLTIAKTMIRLDGELALSHRIRLAEGSFAGTTDEYFSGLALGAGFGISDDVEVGISGYRMVGHRPRAYPDLGGTSQGALPLVFNPDFDFGDVRVYGRARAIRDADFELAFEASIAIPVDSWFALQAGAPLRARLSERFVLDASLEFLLEFGRPVFDPFGGVDDDETSISMLVPVRGVLQLAPSFWIAGQSGLDFYDFDIDRFTMPLTGELGVTMHDGSAPLMDVVLGFHFPYFLTPGADGDKLPAHLWQITLGMNGYFQL